LLGVRIPAFVYRPAERRGRALEPGARRDSSAYRRNILNNRECKITAFHRSVEEMLDS
jgi:hypothetical protein